MRCPKCRSLLEEPRELPDGLPGVKYRECLSCGYTVAVTKKPRKVRLDEA
jgi:Zn ribbon nucleic-acid-binding protein